MPFTVADFHDLVQVLEERPEWRTELRRLVLSADYLNLPEELAEHRRETERRFQALAAQVDKVSRVQERLAEEFAEHRRETDRHFQELSRTLRDVADKVETLKGDVGKLTDDVGKLKGSDLERRYRERAYAHFGRFIRRAHVLTEEELADLLEAGTARGVLSDTEADEVMWADLVVRGRRRDDGSEVFLVVEVSWGVGPQDVERAGKRARLLARMVAPVLPVVAGEAVTTDAARRAVTEGVWQVLPGRVVPPETAVALS